MSPPISRSPRSVVHGFAFPQAAPREGQSLQTELGTALYPLLQLLGQLLKVPLVYLELAQPGSDPHSSSKGILYRDPQGIPAGEPFNLNASPGAEQWPFHESFLLQTEQGIRLADLHLLDCHPRQLSSFEREQIDLVALSLKHILLQAQEHRQTLEQLQSQLQDSRSTAARYQQIFENAVEGIFQTTLEGKYLVANPALAHIFGYESPEDLMHNVSDIGTQIYSDPAQRAEFIQRMLREGQVVNFEHQVCCKDGRLIWISLNARTIYNDQGDPLYFEGFVTDITASRQLKERQQQLEEARRESEHRFLQLAENTQQLFWITTLYSKELIYVSPACEALWGLSAEEAYANPQAWMRQIHPDDRWLFPTILKAQSEGKSTDVVFRIYHTDGRLIWLRERTFPIADKEGKIYRVAGIAEDITESKQLEAERRRIEQAWQQSANHFRQIFELAPNGIALVDLQGRFIQVNDAFAQIVGYTPEELKHRQQLDILHPEDVNPLLGANEALLAGKVSVSQRQIRYTHRSGQVVHVLFQATLLTDEEGQPTQFLNQVIDISARVEAEIALKESEERFRQSFEWAPIAKAMTHLDGTYLQINAAFTETLGYTLEDLKGKTVLDITHPDDIATTLENSNRLLAGEVHQCEQEQRYIHRSGKVVWCRLAVSAVRDPEGKNLFIIGICEDITEEKRAKLQIQAALQEKEVLLREIHHRVKNNLQIISSLLRLQADQIKSRKYARVFKDAGSRIQAMSLIHEGLYQSNNLAAVDLKQYLHNLISNLFHSYGVNPESIRANIRAEGIRLNLDDAVLCGLIINELVTNSLKYAFPKGRSGEIEIHFSQTRKYTQLRVSDNGVGLPPNFDFKETQSLGLQLVATLTDQLQGKIQLRSKPGTTFIITFPRSEP